MALENRFVVLEETRQNMERNYGTSRSKIQTVPSYMREREKYEKYYSPKLISIGPIHHGETKLQRGEQYKLMWASMYAEESQQTPQLLYKRIVDNIAELRGLFLWDEIGLALERDVHYNDEDLAWLLFVDGCAVLHILEKENRHKPWDLKVKLDLLVLVQRDLLLLENQLPYQLLKLLSEDEAKLKVSMRGVCELQNMFTLLESIHRLRFGKPAHHIQMVEQSSPPTHLLDCLRTSILSSGMESIYQDGTRIAVPFEKTLQFGESRTTYRNIQELKAAAIRVKRQKIINLKNISFSSSFFGGKLHLTPLVLDDSTVPTLLNLVAYEMCPDFKNEFEISSYIKLLDLLIDNIEDVKELRSSGILHNSLGCDEEVVELFNTISSGLVHNPILHHKIRKDMEENYKNRYSIWMADAYYTYFKSPWTILASLAALLALVLTALQTWQGFKSN